MNTPQYWNVNKPGQSQQPSQSASSYQPVGLTRMADSQAMVHGFANSRQPEAIIVFDLMGMVTSLVAKSPFFQTRLSSITPGTHYMLVLLQMGYNAQQMDQLTSTGEYVGTSSYPGARILQQHGGAAGGVMMLYAPLQELNNDPTMMVVKNDTGTEQGKQAFINPTTYQAADNRQHYQQSSTQAQSQLSYQAQQHYQPQGQPRQDQSVFNPQQPQQPVTQPQPIQQSAPPFADTQALIEAAVKAALAEQAARLAAQQYVQPQVAPQQVLPVQPITAYVPTPEPVAPAVDILQPVSQSIAVETTEPFASPTTEQPKAYAQAPIPATEPEPLVEVVEPVAAPKAASQPPLYALAEDMPNSFVVHPVGAHAKGHFIWQHRNNDLHIIAYGIVIPASPTQDVNQVVDLVQNSLHSVVVQLGNAEADDIMIGLNEVFQSKITTASEESKSAYVEVSVCILNYKQKIVDLSGAPYGSFFLRAGNVSGIQNGRIAALASQMRINKQDLRCARFKMDELNAVYLFSIGSVVKGYDATKASKVHNQVMNMLESVMKMPYKEQQEAMKSHLSMLIGQDQGLPILIGIKTS